MIRTLCFTFMFSTPALAEMTQEEYAAAVASLQSAATLASIIGSAEPCGYIVSDEAVARYVETIVAPDDTSFASNLQLSMYAYPGLVTEMPAAQKIAHCTAVRQNAVALGLAE